MRHLRHVDLGVLDGAVLLFGGPYSNAHAVDALLSEAAARAIVPSHMICTGDVVAYAGQPTATIAAMREQGIAVVAGNCEIQLAAGATDCGCGFESGSACDLLSMRWFCFASQTIAPSDKMWMAGLPDVISFVHQGARYGVIHGGVTDVARFVWPTSQAEVFELEWQALELSIGPVDHIIAGHSGIPFIRDTPRGRWINAGVVGMPPHDGRQQTRFAVLDGGEVQIHRLDYDAQAAARAMAQAGLPPDYARSMISGYWPSEDILPEGLRAPSLANG
ncbi:metallophosphoesterase family protein [Sulfitobacter aestuariivivens]|uniref:Metallophosphoesterase family protein n=1 Tax=Sulfitobacter aestuariivivens TaxID=2766981 RepID=A0A927D2A8_9RHOB|nr:metallophosphoesterase family protein [Sulfitobacter aestuariivivens]MBD3663096.1 metallophosphoesterase family protein [Sulfitobacter aestuariivivens]